MSIEKENAYFENEYLGDLRKLEEMFGVDLSRSKELPFDLVNLVRAWAVRYIDWVRDQGYITPDQSEFFSTLTGNYFVFDEEEHREIRIAVKRRKIAEIEAMNPIFASDHIRQLRGYEQQPVPPGNMLHARINGNGFPLVTFTAWPYTERTPFNYLPVEGIVAEETMHLLAMIQQVEEYPSVFLPYLEEAGAKHYSIEVMRAMEVTDDALARYNGYGGRQGSIWYDFIQSVGEEKAAAVFFQAEADAVTKMTLYECIR